MPHSNRQHVTFTLHKLWTPPAPPLLEGEVYTFGTFELARSANEQSNYLLKWDIRAPKMTTTTGTAILQWGVGIPTLIST